MRRFTVGLLLCALTACASPRDRESVEESTAISETPASGVLVRHLRVRCAPAHTKGFEALLQLAVRAAGRATSKRDDWLCYREPPGRYWLVLFGAPTKDARSGDGLARFVHAAFAEEKRPVRREASRLLGAIEYEVEWDLLTQQKPTWSTVDDMSTSTHPKARLMLRTVRPGAERAFDRALRRRTAFLATHGYPLPIEGFVVRSGAQNSAIQVVFPTDWPSFHDKLSFGPFVKQLEPSARAEYARRKEALLQTMSRAEFYDASFVPEMSFSSRPRD